MSSGEEQIVWIPVKLREVYDKVDLMYREPNFYMQLMRLSVTKCLKHSLKRHFSTIVEEENTFYKENYKILACY